MRGMVDLDHFMQRISIPLLSLQRSPDQEIASRFLLNFDCDAVIRDKQKCELVIVCSSKIAKTNTACINAELNHIKYTNLQEALFHNFCPSGDCNVSRFTCAA